jgi:hypothetical protein
MGEWKVGSVVALDKPYVQGKSLPFAGIGSLGELILK